MKTKKQKHRSTFPKKGAKKSAKAPKRSPQEKARKIVEDLMPEPVMDDVVSLEEILKAARTAPPEKPDDSFTKLAVRLVTRGLSPDVAIRVLGLPLPLYRVWLRQGLKDLMEGNYRSPFCIFVRALDMADAEDERNDIIQISAGVRHAAALIWKRSRKAPMRWGDKGAAGFADDLLTEAPAQIKAPTRPEILSIVDVLSAAGCLEDVLEDVIDTTAEEVDEKEEK